LHILDSSGGNLPTSPGSRNYHSRTGIFWSIRGRDEITVHFWMRSDSTVYVDWYVEGREYVGTLLTNLALFIVPYLQLVFGLECALRSLRKSPFQARGKYDVTICCAVVVLLLIGTWLLSHLMPQPNSCFASLVWFVAKFGKLGLVLLSITAGLMTLSAVIIFIRLSKVSLIDEQQRIAASRMVFYLVLGIVSLVSYSRQVVPQTNKDRHSSFHFLDL
jgi:hypothetical protein